MASVKHFEFETNIGEDDIIVKVFDYIKVPPYMGSPHNCDSDWDYYGYEDYTFDVYDLNGNIITTTEFEKKLIEDKIRDYIYTNTRSKS